jgi:hypothetical protein
VRLTSPGYPNFYEPNSLCVYEIGPANSTYCGFSLLFRHLSLELSVDQMGRCNKDYLELPNNERVCGTTKPLESKHIVIKNYDLIAINLLIILFYSISHILN